MFGLRVDRNNRLWKPLTNRQRGAALAVGMLLIASVAFAAFVNLNVVGSVSGTAAGASGISIVIPSADSFCQVLTPPGTCVMTAGPDNKTFNLTLNGQNNDSVVRLDYLIANAADSGVTLCLQSLPTWAFGTYADIGVQVDLLKNIAPGGTRHMDTSANFSGITAGQNLTTTITLVFGSAGCVP